MNAATSSIRLIAGLGNPGEEYAHTRHNAGFLTVDALCKAFPNVTGPERQCSGLMWKCRVKGDSLYLFKPMTFMNLSGTALSQVQKLLNIAPEEILVVYDDLDLPVGSLRLRPSGRAGGHNGISSVIQELGTERIPRLRVGIGKTDARRHQVNYVLSAFDAEDEAPLAQAMQDAVSAVKLLLARGMSAAMNQFNKKAVVTDVAVASNPSI